MGIKIIEVYDKHKGTYGRICSILDLYNNGIITSNVSTNNDWGLVSKMLYRLEINNKIGDEKIILHTYQGYQFTSYLYK